MKLEDKYKIVAKFLGSEYITETYKPKNGEPFETSYWTKPIIGYQKDVGGLELSARWQIGIFDFDKDWNVVYKIIDYISSLGHEILNGYFWDGYIERNDFRLFRPINIDETFEEIYQFVVYYNKIKNKR